MPAKNDSSIVTENNLSSSGLLLPVTSALTILIISFLVIAFFKGWTFNFYLNIIFGFYALTHQMWISVILLGVTQTLIMMPLRAIRVYYSHSIQRFQEKVEEETNDSERFVKVKKDFHQGNLAFLFYLVDFMTQLTLFISIGRLFLTDFYSNKINPSALVSFIPYPEYPLQGLFFKIPYPVVTSTQDFGLRVVGWAWFAIILIHIIIYIVRTLVQQTKQTKQTSPVESKYSNAIGYIAGSLVALFAITYLVIRHFPTSIAVRIFTGDVSKPNNTLNTITAIVTFMTFFWFGIQDLLRKGKLAEQEGVPAHIVDATQKEMFRDSLMSSSLIGLGAYLITNRIPSAFELSIFTLEIISLLSPLTLDKVILKLKQPKSDS